MIEAKSCGRIEETVCEDRISELPEDLLVKILDLVPTKDAVVTMFLSKRWYSIWTMKLTLAYKDSDAGSYYNHEEKRKKSVWRFLDKSMQLHKAPVINSLCMELGPQCPTHVDVVKWVASAVDRRVRVLEFNLLWSADPTRLPKSLYTCETLVELTLSHKILVDFPSSSSSSSCLQSLRILGLHFVVYKDEESLLRFLSSCPILDVMSVRRKKDDNVKRFTVKVPSLWSLFYTNYTYNDVGDTGRCLVIDTPALERLIIVDVSGDYCSLNRMPCLDYANIHTESYPDDRFLKSISSVLSLEFVSTQLLCCSTIYFSHLTKLTILPEKSDWRETLMVLLRNSPKVKNLKVDCLFNVKDFPRSWNQQSSIPECLSLNLEIFTWEKYRGREEEEQFLTYILANAMCLKTAKISLRTTLSLEEQQMMMEKLKDIPRVSTASQLLFK